MKLRTFSVAGEALNFGARRMETIMRVAWLPIVLLLVLNMATVMAVLSVAYGRLISFADAGSWAIFQAAIGKYLQQLATMLATQGPQAIPKELYYIVGTSFLLQMILIASFMAPLIRYAGLGERPAPGVVRLEFGAAQLRFALASILSSLVIAALIIAPVAAAAYYAMKYIAEAMMQTYASFPDPNSLHTIELLPAQQVITARGDLWFYNRAVPLIAVAPFAFVLWVALILHFHPKNLEGAGSGNILTRVVGALASVVALSAAFWLSFYLLAKVGYKMLITVILTIVSPLLATAYLFTGKLSIDQLAIVSVIVLFFYYFSLRIAPYQGVAVCRGSMAPGGTLKVTRGWNIMRLFIAGFVLSAVLSTASFLINQFMFGFIGMVTNFLYAATSTATKLVNSGAEAEWVRVFFVWAWNIIKILVNLFWAFFSYGAVAGYLGRLYRESERANGEPVARAPWHA